MTLTKYITCICVCVCVDLNIQLYIGKDDCSDEQLWSKMFHVCPPAQLLTYPWVHKGYTV